MKIVDVDYRPMDFKEWRGKRAQNKHVSTFIDEPCVIQVGGVPKILYDLMPCPSLFKVLSGITYDTGSRTGGMKSTSRTFGRLPRLAIQRDYCTVCRMDKEDPLVTGFLYQLGQRCQDLYQKTFPRDFLFHKTCTDEINEDWRLGDLVYTGGIINKNNALTYHKDMGNYKGTMSAMVVTRRDVSGGRLIIPEIDLGINLADQTVLIFNGADLIHGVTQVLKTQPHGVRYSVVFYTLREMRKCLPAKQELERIKKTATIRQTKRAGLTGE